MMLPYIALYIIIGLVATVVQFKIMSWSLNVGELIFFTLMAPFTVLGIPITLIMLAFTSSIFKTRLF